MKKLYVTVTDDVYSMLESYIKFKSSDVIGISKSSVVNDCLLHFFVSFADSSCPEKFNIGVTK